MTPLVSENDKSNTNNLMDSLLFKMPLDRKFYKKQIQQYIKKEKFNDKFEQQLRCGYEKKGQAETVHKSSLRSPKGLYGNEKRKIKQIKKAS